MHELGVATALVDLAQENAGKRRLTALNLAVGANSGIFRDSLLFYLDLLFEERALKPVEVRWRDVPLRFKCVCGHEYESVSFASPCPSCGSVERDLVGGGDCFLDSIEVEDG